MKIQIQLNVTGPASLLCQSVPSFFVVSHMLVFEFDSRQCSAKLLTCKTALCFGGWGEETSNPVGSAGDRLGEIRTAS